MYSTNFYLKLQIIVCTPHVTVYHRAENEQESHRAYGTADEALSTTLVMFKKMFLF